jgi:hypothetical protein
MAKTYVIGIGGTGSRIIRSLTVLLASGADTQGHSIVPVLIDLDLSNGDTSEAFRLVESYINLRNKMYGNSSIDGVFLKTKIEALSEGKTAQEGNKISFIESNQEFAEFIGYRRAEEDTSSSVLSEIDKCFIDSIYSTSEKTGEKELELNMSRGFKGHPNIGVLAFNEIKNNNDFIDLLSVASSEGNRIFIISSIFGGTGASGFPQIIKLIDVAGEPKEKGGLGLNAGINRIPVGALSVFPYFNVKSAKTGMDDSIQSSTFMTKSKAALYYYEKQLSRLNVMYNLYDDPKNSFDNNSGGEDQRNAAHWVELMGGYSVLHFIKSDIQDAKTYQKSLGFFSAYKESEKSLPNEINYYNFYRDSRDNALSYIIKAAISWFISNKLIPNDIADRTTYTIELNLRNNSSKEYSMYTDYRGFLNAYFKQWIDEIQSNQRSLRLFNFEANSLVNFLVFKSITKDSGESFKKLMDVSTDILNSVASDVQKKYKQLDPEIKYMRFLENSVQEIYNQYKI